MKKSQKFEIMEDLIAIQGKSIAELREIAKVLGITEEKLSKKELIARISSIGTSEESTEAPKAETAEEATPAPQKRKRARLGSVKVEAKPAAVVEKPAGAEEVVAEPATPAEPSRVRTEVTLNPNPAAADNKITIFNAIFTAKTVY